MTRHFRVRLRVFAMTVAAFLPAVSVAMFILDPPSLAEIRSEPNRTAKIRPFLCGQIGLIATWAALGGALWCARWAAAALTFVLTIGAIQAADPVLATYFFQPWEIHTVALLSFTLFCALRAVGMRVEAICDVADETSSARQFNLRRLFAWVTCVAVITLAWKHWFAVEVQRAQHWPADLLPDCRPLSFATAVSFTVAGLVASLAILRRQPLRWWMLALAPAIAAFHATVYCLAFNLTVKAGGLTWWDYFANFCRRDVLLHFAPVAGVLLLVRAAGYRLAWAGEREE